MVTLQQVTMYYTDGSYLGKTVSGFKDKMKYIIVLGRFGKITKIACQLFFFIIINLHPGIFFPLMFRESERDREEGESERETLMSH